MNKSQVLVIGGGPSGSSAAYFTAKQGIDVTLIDKDKWPREKVCGGGLTANCFPVLDKMGLTPEVDKIADFKFNGYVIYSPTGETIEAPIRQRDGQGSREVLYSYVIRRSVFDQLLLNKAREAGAKVLTEVEAKDVKMGEPIKVITNKGEEFSCEILVVADGSGSPITRQFVKDVYKGSAIAIKGIFSGVKGLSKRLEFFLDDNLGFGYGWIFPMAGGRANIGVGLDIAYLKKRKINIRQLFAQMLEKPVIEPRMTGAKPEGRLQSFPLRMGFDRAAFCQGRVLFAGDAAKLIYPLSGEGIAYALQSGEIAAKAIGDVYSINPNDFGQLKRYEIECQRTFADFEPATRLQKLLGRPRIQKFFFTNAVCDYDLGQKAIGALENSTGVKTFFNLSTIIRSFYIAAKRKLGIKGER